MTRRRLDAELVRRDLARSRQQASELIASGRVRVNRMVATKPATQVEDSAPITVDAPEREWVSRGAHKLVEPLADFGLLVVLAVTEATDMGLMQCKNERSCYFAAFPCPSASPLLF